MARLYANENLPHPVVLELRRLGDDVLSMSESGQAGRGVPDMEVLEFAEAAERAVVTLNRRHFVRLHQEHPSHAGIIVCTFDPDFQSLAARIHHAAAADLRGRLLRVNRPAG
jgi:hypothetical protein